MNIGIVIPAFRPDVGLLVSYIEELEEELKPKKVYVELDDPVSNEVVQTIKGTSATVIISETRRGKGAAVTAGFEKLDTDIYCFLDADGSTPVNSVRSILQPLLDDSTDVSAGSRRHPNSIIKSHQTRFRRYLGDGLALLGRLTLPTHMYDYQCGAKAMTANAWRQIRDHLYEEGFAWDLEMLAIAGALDLTVTEIPIIWEDKLGSTVDPLPAIADLLRALIAVRHRSKVIDGHRIHSMLPQSRSNTLLSDD